MYSVGIYVDGKSDYVKARFYLYWWQTTGLCFVTNIVMRVVQQSGRRRNDGWSWREDAIFSTYVYVLWQMAYGPQGDDIDTRPSRIRYTVEYSARRYDTEW